MQFGYRSQKVSDENHKGRKIHIILPRIRKYESKFVVPDSKKMLTEF